MISPQLARIRSFEVVPALPEPLQPMLDIAYNLWWSWHPEAVELFIRLDRDLWRSTHHNPVKMLGTISQEKLDAAARDDGFLTALKRVRENLTRHLDRTPWLESARSRKQDFTVAYFCAEFGLTECLQIYSGGLGCLAGDHLKSASELGMPMVAVGLLYRNGYFQQYLNNEGWQQEINPDLDFSNLPVTTVKDAKGNPVNVGVELPGREVRIALWKADVGRIPLYLLDTNLPENDPHDRAITAQLYGGDMEHRMKQEIVLGIGGVRALEAIGIRPDVCHMNEGHSAFLGLERIRRLIEEHDLSFDEARQQASASHVFTTHTPVPAGIDRFPPDMVKRYFEKFVPSLRLDMEGLLSMGRENVYNPDEFFSMAVLAIRTANGCNGVSKLHGEVAREMWNDIYPQVPEHEVPITHVTNGVHARTWLSPDLSQLFDRYLGGRWHDNPADMDVWTAIEEVPDEELWRVHERRRQRLVVWARRKLRAQLRARGQSATQIAELVGALSDRCLTVGFARRFATYKRGNLMLRDPERMLRMLNNTERPIQFFIAGKAHPADNSGKDLIRQLVKFAEEHGAGHRIVFLENYDMHVARYLVQGCDIWLNTPRRGMEASGTSGMKAAMNGVLNCSILDGWWDEAYESDLGWAIGRRENYANPDAGDDIESRNLYDLFEKQILPLFYDRGEDGIPHRWVELMKNSISRLAPRFNTNRMVQEYAEHLYLPSVDKARQLARNDLAAAREQAQLKHRLRDQWERLSITHVDTSTESALGVHQPLDVTADAYLGDLEPGEVKVQAYIGLLDNDGNVTSGRAHTLQHDKKLGDGKHRFTGRLAADASGRHGFAIRIVPGDDLLDGIAEPGLIKWEHPAAASKKPETPALATA